MPGVSNRGPVAAADGFGKVYLKFRPVKKRVWVWGILVYSAFFSIITFTIVWSRPVLREEYLIPVVRRAAGFAEALLIMEKTMQKHSKNGVPTVAGHSLSKAMYYQGYEHATKRFLQMEIYRRTALGQLSELFGERSVDIDTLALTLNFAGIANSDFTALDADSLSILSAYAQGVNKYISEMSVESPWRLPLDYAPVLGSGAWDRGLVRIEPWSPVHTLAVMRLTAYEWSTGWESDVLSVLFEGKSDLFASTNSENQPLSHILPSLGGSAFAVAKRLSQSGGAILGSSVESMASSSGVWFQNCIVAPSVHVCGASIPGVPLVYHGKNPHIAWSMLPSGVHSERLVPVTPHRGAVVERTEAIKVRSGLMGNDTLLTLAIREFVATDENNEAHGKVVLPLVGDMASKQLQSALTELHAPELAVRSPALLHLLDTRFLLQLATSSDWSDFTAACSTNAVLPVNMLYVDVSGNIGSVSHGGSDAPATYSYNPESGFIILAQNSAATSASRIHDLVRGAVSSGRKLSSEQAVHFLRDLYSPSSLRLARLISGIEPASVSSASVRKTLQHARTVTDAFDGFYTSSSAAPVLLEAFRTALFHNVLNLLDAQSASAVLSRLDSSAIKRFRTGDSAGQSWLLDLLESPESSAQRGLDRNKVIGASIYEAYQWCQQHFGAAPAAWRWGAAHKAHFAHPSVPSKWYLSDAVYSRGPSPSAGGFDSVLSTHHTISDRLTSRTSLCSISGTVASSLRLLFDMAPAADRYYAAISTGQSSSVGSRWYGHSALSDFISDETTGRWTCFTTKCIESESGGSLAAVKQSSSKIEDVVIGSDATTVNEGNDQTVAEL